jgi:hypothetical protein
VGTKTASETHAQVYWVMSQQVLTWNKGKHMYYHNECILNVFVVFYTYKTHGQNLHWE